MEEKYQFYEIKTAAEEYQYKCPFYMRFLPVSWKEKRKENFICQRLPVSEREKEHFGITGKEITIPYTFMQLQNMEKDKADNIIQRIIQREGVQNIVAQERLHSYLDAALILEENLIPVLYVREILTWIRKQHQISQKDMHLVLIDSGGSAAGFVLGQLGEDMNHLTILTRRPEYFEEYSRYMYEQNGLLVTLGDIELGHPVEGNIVLDLCSDEAGLYTYPEASIVMQVLYDREKTKKTLAKRKQIICYNRLFLVKGAIPVDNKILQAGLCERTRAVTAGRLEGLYQQAHRYGFTIERLGIRV